jgi:acylphosphatase
MPTVSLTIKGKVQGVFFRATAKEMADKIGVKGWVKNTLQGDVEAMVTGSTQHISQFVDWCNKGPALAKVSEVLQTDVQETYFENFTVAR